MHNAHPCIFLNGFIKKFTIIVAGSERLVVCLLLHVTKEL